MGNVGLMVEFVVRLRTAQPDRAQVKIVAGPISSGYNAVSPHDMRHVLGSFDTSNSRGETMKSSWTLAWGLAALAAQLFVLPAQAGLFQMDFATQENFDDIEWDTFGDLFFADEEEFPLTDWSGGGDNDVILSILDEVDGFGDGFTGNNPDQQQTEF